MFSFPKFMITVAAMVIVTVVSTSEMSAQNQNYFSPVKTQDVFDHWVKPGESCELIARKYYLVEDASLLLAENPWLANRPVWGRNGVISYRIHPGEVIRIRWGGHSAVAPQPQPQPVQIIENSFVNSPVFWIAVGFFFMMLIALSIIIGILWGGGLFEGKFKSQHLDTDKYLKYIFSYIHLNPIKLIQKDWKEKGIKNKKEALEYLNKYEYSSFLDYLKDCNSRKNSKILNKKYFPNYFLNSKEFTTEILSWFDFKQP